MRAQGSGHIIQVSSLGGITAFPATGVYHLRHRRDTDRAWRILDRPSWHVGKAQSGEPGLLPISEIARVVQHVRIAAALQEATEGGARDSGLMGTGGRSTRHATPDESA